MILNSSLASSDAQIGVQILQFPFTDIAVKLGNIKVANMVALGCFIAAEKIIQAKNILKVFRSMAPAGNLNILMVNQQALEEGQRLKHD